MGRTHTYTEEHINFLREYSPTHTMDDTWETFFDKFEMDINKSSIRYLLKKYNIPYIGREELHSRDIRECGAHGTKKKSFRRTKITGTEELRDIMDDVSTLYGMKKYEICDEAIDLFIKNGCKISPSLVNGKFIKKSRTVNVEIPMDKDEFLASIAKDHYCSVGTLMFQALANYCVNKLPDKKDTFKKILTNPTKPDTKSSHTTKKSNTSGRHFYTEEEVDFIRKMAPEHTYDEIIDAFNTKFNSNITYGGLWKCMQRNEIAIGKKSSVGRKPGGHNSTTNTTKKSDDSIPKKLHKYYVEGMEEINIKKDEVSQEEETPVEVTEDIEQAQEVVVDVPDETIPEIEATIPLQEPLTQGILEGATVKPKPSKRYMMPHDIPKIVEKVRKVTNQTRFEFCNSAIKYYLAKKWHIDRRFKLAKYVDAQWLNSKFVQPVVITLDNINLIEQVADKFHCKSSAIILQAYLDYCSKIFEDFGIEFNYVFEADTMKKNTGK